MILLVPQYEEIQLLKEIEMKKLFLAAALCLSTSAIAEVWFAAGLLTTQVKGQAARVEFIETDGFDSKATCQHFVKSEAL